MKYLKAAGGLKTAGVFILLFLCLIIYMINPSFFSTLGSVLLSGNIKEITRYIDSFGNAAMLFSFLLVVIANMLGFLPAILFSTANVMLFGIIPGIILSWLAETVGATVAFLLMRTFFRSSAEKLIARNSCLTKIDNSSNANGFQAMLIARAIPYIPSGVLNALGAISKISLRDYVLATLLGKLPSTVVEAMMGRYALTIHTNSLRAAFIIVTIGLVYGAIKLYKRNKAKDENTFSQLP
jgi:uncharacterized membrane protein YdjX (TVP38/TMEM64 family)